MPTSNKRGTFAERLRALREKKEVTQKEVGDLVGVTDAAVGMWEQGKRLPDAETIARLADFFGVTVDYLVGRVDDPASHDPSTPPWWYRDTPPTDVELEEFLKTANVHFDGAPLTDEDKEDIMTYLKVKWERERRKREKNDNTK
ncbi:MAG: helix-turn-helix domain-containing protein [Firmicutes bacterium]|nr:helix-turn-helix domain-containing protein [Bacillota bacterium]